MHAVDFDLCTQHMWPVLAQHGTPVLHAGTGKTTIARRVGKLFQQLGILATDEVVECSAGDFKEIWDRLANQSAGKTQDMFKEALGGVLFIDEAYTAWRAEALACVAA
jgi:hypothetical protein